MNVHMNQGGTIPIAAKLFSTDFALISITNFVFRALKTKHDTPKYGLIYHASLIGQSQPKNKGKVRSQV